MAPTVNKSVTVDGWKFTLEDAETWNTDQSTEYAKGSRWSSGQVSGIMNRLWESWSGKVAKTRFISLTSILAHRIRME